MQYRLIRVLLTSVTSPALKLLHTTITVQSVVTPSEHERATRETAMADTSEGVLGALVGNVVVGVAQLLVHDPNHGKHTKGSEAAAVTETVHVRGVDQRIIRHRKATSAARRHFPN
jgi:hypothetical protein